MQPGFPPSGGGAYPALQRRSNVGSLTSPVPVVNTSNGVQNNGVATQYPEELKVAHGPDQWKEGGTHSQQHFQHHQLESQASAASTGYQCPKPRDGVCTCSSCHQISKKATTDFYSSVHVSAERSTCYKRCVCNGGKHRKCSKQKIDFVKESYLSYNTGLQQKRLFDCGLSAGTSSAATLGNGLGIAAQTSLHESNANNEITTKSQEVKTSLVILSCGQTETKILDDAGGTPSTLCSQDVSFPFVRGLPFTDKDSPVRETEPLTDDQILDFIKERCAYFRSILNQQDRNSSQLQSNKGHDFCTYDGDFTRHSDITPKFNSVPVPTTCTFYEQDANRRSLSCPSLEGCTAAFGQAFKEDISKGSKDSSELTMSKETGNWTTSTSEKHSAGKLVSAVGNSKPAIKKEPVNKRELADFDLPVKKHLMRANGDSKHVYSADPDDKGLVCSKYESVQRKWYDKYLQNGITMLHYSLTALKELIASLDNVEAIAKMDRFSEDLLQQHGNGEMENIHLFASTDYPQIMKNVAASCTWSEDESPVQHTAAPEMTVDEMTEKQPNLTLNCSSSQECRLPWLNADKSLGDKDQVPVVSWARKHMMETKKGGTGLKPVDNAVTHQSEGLCSQTSHEGLRVHGVSVCSQTDLSSALSENKVMEQAPLSESKGGGTLFGNIIKNPLYEDISDVEDINEDEKPQNEDISVERLIPEKQVSPKTESLDTAQHCSNLCFSEADDTPEHLCPKSDSKAHVGWQTNLSIPYSPSSVLRDEDETDDWVDDDWIVIPITMSELKFELEDEDQDSPENVLLNDNGGTGEKEKPCGTNLTHCELHRSSPKPVPASACSQIEVFDTIDSFLKAKAGKHTSFEVAPCSSTAEQEMDSEGELYIPQNKQASHPEPENPSETEDSCDYSSGSEHNYLTVSRELLKRSAPLPPETDFSMSENEGEDNEVTSVQKSQSMDELNSTQKLKEAKCPSKIPKEDIIVIHSDTEGGNEQNSRKKARRKRSFSSVSTDGEDAACSQQKKYSPAIVDSRCNTVKGVLTKKRPPSACPALQCKSTLNHAQFKEEMETACPDLSHTTESTENGEQLIESKASSEHVQHKVKKRQISENDDVIIIDSDTEDDDNDQNYKNASRKRLLSSGLAYADDPLCVQQKRHSSETGDCEYGTPSERAQDTRHLTKPKGGSDHVQHKTKRQKTSKREVFCHSAKVAKRVNTKDLLPSGSEAGDNAMFAAQNRPSSANKQPDKTRLSYDGSPEQQPLRVSEGEASTLGPKPIIPRLFLGSKDLTMAPKTASGKKTGASEGKTRHVSRDRKGRFVCKSNPVNDRHHALEVNVTKPRPVSRLLSLPNQESVSSMSITRGQFFEARQRSLSTECGEISTTTSTLTKSAQRTSIPREHASASKRQCPHSYSSTSTKGQSSSVTMQSSAKTRLTKDWQDTVFPIQRDRKTSHGVKEDLRTTNHNLWRESKQGPRAPRQRRSSHKSVTPLMKKTKIDAIQWTKAINRDKEQRSTVGEGYKWSEASNRFRQEG